MKISSFKQVSLAVLALGLGSLITGCGSSGGGGSSKAQFVDSPVAGISYETSSGKKGITDANGKFDYKKGDQVTFSIGTKLVLPAGIAQGGIITPAHLAGTADWENSTVAKNIIRLLLTFDEDGDPSNGIQIPEGLGDWLDEDIGDGTVDFSRSDFFSNFNEILADIYADLNLTLTVVDEKTAVAHFKATIEDLGIEIEIQIVSKHVTCTAANTAAIKGYYMVELTTGEITGTKTVEIDGTELEYDGKDIDGSCTFIQTKVDGIKVGEITTPTMITNTWAWTKGSDVYTVNSTDSSLTFMVSKGSNTGTGNLSLAPR